jgi:hypothetical protein
MKQNETKNPQNPQNPKMFFCVCCEYITGNKKDFTKHVMTPKHQNYAILKQMKQMKQKIPKNPQKSPELNCCCGCSFNSRTTLWRHKKKCEILFVNKLDTDKDKEKDKELIMNLIKENIELKNMVLDVCQKIQPLGNTINSHNINSNNKTFNLNVFLNEHCKDAMNIMDFVDSLKLQLSDLESVGKLGFVNGISNIIVKKLNSLDETKRPIHCTDAKREVLYVKDEDKWEKENENKKIRKAIKHIAHKNSKLIPEFKAKHPDCVKSDSKYSDQYNKLIIEAMGGSGDNDSEKEDKIIKNIAREVIIDKTNY